MQMLHFQLVREMSPFTAALKALPLPIALLPAATNSDKLVEKFGRPNVVSTGILLIASGLLLFSLIEIDTNYWYIAATFVLIGGGMGLTMAPSTTAVMDSVPESKAGVGSATNDASREVGGALGIAVGGSVLNQIYQSSIKIPDSALGKSDTIESSFPSAINVGKQMIADGNMEGAELIASAKEAFLDGMIAACLVAACVAIIAAIIVKWKLPNDDVLAEKN
jgi:MFS family permease